MPCGLEGPPAVADRTELAFPPPTRQLLRPPGPSTAVGEPGPGIGIVGVREKDGRRSESRRGRLGMKEAGRGWYNGQVRVRGGNAETPAPVSRVTQTIRRLWERLDASSKKAKGRTVIKVALGRLARKGDGQAPGGIGQVSSSARGGTRLVAPATTDILRSWTRGRPLGSSAGGTMSSTSSSNPT